MEYLISYSDPSTLTRLYYSIEVETAFMVPFVSDTFSPREESHVGEARRQLADFTLKTIVKVLSR